MKADLLRYPVKIGVDSSRLSNAPFSLGCSQIHTFLHVFQQRLKRAQNRGLHRLLSSIQ